MASRGDAPLDDAALVRAIQSAAVGGDAPGTQRVNQILMRGPSPSVLAAGLDALAALGRPEGTPSVLRYLRHRRAAIRRHAIAAARAIHTPELVRALTALLGDPVEAVRVDVVSALSDVGTHTAVTALFTAFERDLNDSTRPEGGSITQSSALAIARFGTPDDIHRLLGYVGRAPFSVITTAMRAVLRRDDLVEAAKVQVVTTIGRLATHDARVFLETAVSDAGDEETPVTREARSWIGRIGQ